MKTIIASVTGFLVVAAFTASAWAACPPGTKYDCQQVGNKQSCGCR